MLYRVWRAAGCWSFLLACPSLPHIIFSSTLERVLLSGSITRPRGVYVCARLYKIITHRWQVKGAIWPEHRDRVGAVASLDRVYVRTGTILFCNHIVADRVGNDPRSCCYARIVTISCCRDWHGSHVRRSRYRSSEMVYVLLWLIWDVYCKVFRKGILAFDGYRDFSVIPTVMEHAYRSSADPSLNHEVILRDTMFRVVTLFIITTLTRYKSESPIHQTTQYDSRFASNWRHS